MTNLIRPPQLAGPFFARRKVDVSDRSYIACSVTKSGAPDERNCRDRRCHRRTLVGGRSSKQWPLRRGGREGPYNPHRQVNTRSPRPRKNSCAKTRPFRRWNVRPWPALPVENLHLASLTKLERDDNVAEWIRITERILSQHAKEITKGRGLCGAWQGKRGTFGEPRFRRSNAIADASMGKPLAREHWFGKTDLSKFTDRMLQWGQSRLDRAVRRPHRLHRRRRRDRRLPSPACRSKRARIRRQRANMAKISPPRTTAASASPIETRTRRADRSSTARLQSIRTCISSTA